MKPSAKAPVRHGRTTEVGDDKRFLSTSRIHYLRFVLFHQKGQTLVSLGNWASGGRRCVVHHSVHVWGYLWTRLGAFRRTETLFEKNVSFKAMSSKEYEPQYSLHLTVLTETILPNSQPSRWSDKPKDLNSPFYWAYLSFIWTHL